MGALIQVILALLEAIREYQKNQRLLAEAEKKDEAMKGIDEAFEGDGDAQKLNDIFMHRLSERVSKSSKSSD